MSDAGSRIGALIGDIAYFPASFRDRVTGVPENVHVIYSDDAYRFALQKVTGRTVLVNWDGTYKILGRPLGKGAGRGRHVRTPETRAKLSEVAKRRWHEIHVQEGTIREKPRPHPMERYLAHAIDEDFYIDGEGRDVRD